MPTCSAKRREQPESQTGGLGLLGFVLVVWESLNPTRALNPKP